MNEYMLTAKTGRQLDIGMRLVYGRGLVCRGIPNKDETGRMYYMIIFTTTEEIYYQLKDQYEAFVR